MSDYYIAVPHDDYVVHHGILGQKWGIRRYQNADGSLTDAGKKRYEKQAYKSLKNYAKEADYMLSSYTTENDIKRRNQAEKQARNDLEKVISKDSVDRISNSVSNRYKAVKNLHKFASGTKEYAKAGKKETKAYYKMSKNLKKEADSILTTIGGEPVKKLSDEDYAACNDLIYDILYQKAYERIKKDDY